MLPLVFLEVFSSPNPLGASDLINNPSKVNEQEMFIIAHPSRSLVNSSRSVQKTGLLIHIIHHVNIFFDGTSSPGRTACRETTRERLLRASCT